MAVDKLVDSTQLDADLTSVANAIRIKGGTSGQMAFPAGFVLAIGDIETGITPTGTKQISITANGTTTEDVAAYANAEITVNVQGGGGISLMGLLAGTEPSGDVVANGVTDYYAQLAYNKAVTSFVSNSIAKLNLANGFAKCEALASVRITSTITTLQGNQWDACAALQTLVLPGLTANFPTYGAANCENLTHVDIGNPGQIISNAFRNSRKFNVFIIRRSTVTSLQNVGAFYNTPFASDGAGGTLFVPASLVSQYTQATNWSTLLGYANNSIQAIEGSIYETQYADGTPIT